MLRTALRAKRRRSLERQREQVYRTGFPQYAEIGHAVVWRLRRRGHSRGCALYGGMIAAVGTAKNWMGNPRLAKLTGYSLRQVQRFRAELEAAGYIRSESLEAGDLLDGMNAPAWRAWVCRDVSELQKMAAAALAPERPRKPSAAEVSHTAETTELVSLGEIVAFADKLRDNQSGGTPPAPLKQQPLADRCRESPDIPAGCPLSIDTSELDELDRELARGPPRGS